MFIFDLFKRLFGAVMGSGDKARRTSEEQKQKGGSGWLTPGTAVIAAIVAVLI